MDIRVQANRSSAVAAVLTGCFLAVSGAAMGHGQTSAPAFRVIAFYNGKVEEAHASFVAEANRWFPTMAAQHGFAYESTDDWSKLNRESLSRYDLVVFLDARPDASAQREAFRAYMERGGGWMGFHFAGFALTPSEFPQNWDWYHNEFLGAGSYAGNTWRPTAAVLKVEDKTHPVTQGLPDTFKSAPNEWYKWSTDLRTNANIKILLSIDPASFPLGTGPKLHEIWHTGYYPVVWTNVKYRMVYFNMGHNDIDFASKPGKQLSSTFASDCAKQTDPQCRAVAGKRQCRRPTAGTGQRQAHCPFRAELSQADQRPANRRRHPQSRTKQSAVDADRPRRAIDRSLSWAMERRFPLLGRRRQQSREDDRRVQEAVG